MPIDKLLDSDPRRLGPYRLVGVLGRGGMGEVFLARDRRGRPVAVKRVRPSLMHAREARRRFAREVTAARTVDSPLVAKVLAAAPEADQPWLATEYVPGITLSDAVETYGPLPEPYVRSTARQLTAGLAAIHHAGLVHRDFKPSNVLLTAHGPRVLDFGLARHLHASTFTTSQEFLGTPAFAAPEQWDAANITPAADVFSLASTLVFALRKRSPFESEYMWRVMYAIQFKDPDLSELPPGWARLAGDCLAKDPRDRPSLDEVAEALDAIPSALPSAPPSGFPSGFPSASSSPLPSAPFPSAAESAVLPDGLAALLPPPAAPRPRVLTRRRALRAGAAAALGAGLAGLVSGDRRPGPEVWSYATRGVVHQIVAGGALLYAADDTGCVYAVDARTGRHRWTRRVAPASARPGLGLLPGRTGGLFVTGDMLYALDPATGARRWAVDVPAVGTPAVSARAVCVLTRGADRRDRLALVDHRAAERIALDRESLDGMTDASDSLTPPALTADGTVVVGGREGSVHSFRLGPAERDGGAGTRDHRLLRLPGHGDLSPVAPLVDRGVAYLCTAAKGGLVAVDVRTMDALWTRRLGLDGETWSAPVMATAPASAPRDASRDPYTRGALDTREAPSALVYTTGPASVHAVHSTTGETVWNHYADSLTPASPVVTNGFLYVLTRDGELLTLDAKEGGPALARRAYAPFASGGPVPAPVATPGLVHFATGDRVLRAVPQAGAPV